MLPFWVSDNRSNVEVIIVDPSDLFDFLSAIHPMLNDLSGLLAQKAQDVHTGLMQHNPENDILATGMHHPAKPLLTVLLQMVGMQRVLVDTTAFYGREAVSMSSLRVLVDLSGGSTEYTSWYA